jgi:hypothetical protein
MSPEARLITDETVFREVAARFTADEQFRVQLKADAGKVLESSGIQIPNDVLVCVESDAPGTERLVVYAPENPELTDADLEKVAGGVGLSIFKLRRPVVFHDMIAYAARY